jgi:hypothetical protein
MKFEQVDGDNYFYLDPGELALLGRPIEDDGLWVAAGHANHLLEEVDVAQRRLNGEEAELGKLPDDDMARLRDDARIARSRRRLGQMTALLAEHVEADVTDEVLAAFFGDGSTQ